MEIAYPAAFAKFDRAAMMALFSPIAGRFFTGGHWS
jgi:hypothetical protein